MRLLVTVILIAILAYVLDPGALLVAVKNSAPGWFVLGLAICPLFVLLRIAKWYFLARSNGLRAPFSAVSRLVLVSLVLGLVTPARVGEAVCVVCFPPSSRARGTLLFFVDRLGELCTILIFALPGFLAVPWPMVRLGGCLTAAGALVLVVILTHEGTRGWSARLLKGIMPDRLAAILGGQVRVPAFYWLASLVTYLAAYALIAAFVFAAMEDGSLDFLIYLPIVTLSNLISITIGGLGVREGLAAVLLPLAGVRPEVAASAFFLSFTFTRVLAGLAGVVWNGGLAVGTTLAASESG